MNRQMSLVGMQQKEYMSSVMQILKAVSFHQIYMQKLRQELASNQHYDPKTAFKAIDAFKHNKIVSYQIFSFLQLHGYKTIARQCQNVIQAVNKSLNHLTYDDFLQLTLPSDINLRNISLQRCQNIKMQVGVMGKINNIQNTSPIKIAMLMFKEVQFGRHLLYSRQEFCQKYGGDLYSFNQHLFKGKTNTATFEPFFQLCRKYNYIFNKDQFYALWRRTKEYSVETSVERQNAKPELNLDGLAYLLLTNNLDTKQMIGLRSGADQFAFKEITPSYKYSVRDKYENLKLEQELEKKKKIEQRMDKRKWNKDYKYSYYYPQQQLYPCREQFSLREKQREWENDVVKMDQKQINIRYHMHKKFPTRY